MRKKNELKMKFGNRSKKSVKITANTSVFMNFHYM